MSPPADAVAPIAKAYAGPHGAPGGAAREAMAPAVQAVTRFPLFGAGFRPFFLAAGAWSAMAILIWLGMLQWGLALPSRFDPLAWHIHEMLFGFVPAVVAGFLLTAIASWTNRAPVSGAVLAGLCGVFVAARIACLVSALLPAWCAPGLDAVFFIYLGGVVARELILAGNTKNLVLLAPVAILAAGSLLMHAEAAGMAVPPGLGWRLGLSAMALLMSVIGGRIVPNFTRNFLAQRGGKDFPAPGGLADRAAIVALLLATVCWSAAPAWRPSGMLLLAAGLVGVLRVARWRGLAVRGEALLLVLHAGMVWLACGLAMLGLSVLGSAVPLAAAVHALTVGAIGTMTLGVMSRATLGHTGRSLHAGTATRAIYALVSVAAVIRIGAAAFAGTAALLAAGTLWATGFLLFTLVYGPMLLRPRRQD